MEWDYLQAITKGLSLNDLLNKELIDNINGNLDGKCVEAITIQLRVRDEKLSKDSEHEIVSIANRNSKDTLLKQVIVDADTNKTLNIFIDAINKLEEWFMSGYAAVNGNNNFIDDFLDIFKEFYNSVKDKFTRNDEMSLDEFINKYSDDEKFLNDLEFIKSSLNEISEMMEQINFDYDEYYNFASIKRMITYIVDNLEKYFHYSSFIVLLLENFIDLIVKERQFDDYKEEYEKFDTFLYEKEDFFYTEIFDSDSKYDDAVDKVTNILG